MRFVPGLSYGAHTGSLAYPMRPRAPHAPLFRQHMLIVVCELVHPGNLGPLPPSPSRIASKGDELGLAKYGEFFYR